MVEVVRRMTIVDAEMEEMLKTSQLVVYNWTRTANPGRMNMGGA